MFVGIVGIFSIFLKVGKKE